MTLPVIVLGAGGHAKVLLDILKINQIPVMGMTDLNPKLSQVVLEFPVIGADDKVLQYRPEEIRLVNGLGSTGSPRLRMDLFERFKRQGYVFANVIHPSAIVAADAIIGEGIQVMTGAIIQPGCQIGENCIVNTGAIVDHDCRIGSHVHLAPRSTLSGGVMVGDGVHVGTGAVVIQGLSLGEHSVIGAGAAVIKDVPANTKVVGVPGREV